LGGIVHKFTEFPKVLGLGGADPPLEGENAHTIIFLNPKGMTRLGNVAIDVGIILKWILNEV
jgi:hypothetical protein